MWSIDSDKKESHLAMVLAEIQTIVPEVSGFDESYHSTITHIITDDQLVLITMHPELKCAINQTIQLTTTQDMSDLISKFELMARKMENLSSIVDSTQMHYNSKCEVHTPGNTLTVYNDVRVVEDKCTDELQELLNDGWRIIAACPQPDQRRPDYILGRYNPNTGL